MKYDTENGFTSNVVFGTEIYDAKNEYSGPWQDKG